MSAPLKHGTEVVSAQSSPDGRRVVTASGNSARVWEARPGQTLGELLKPGASVWSAQFSPDGEKVLTVGEGTARLWYTPTFPLAAPRHVADWFEQLNEEGNPLVVPWTGTSESSRAQGKKIRLFKTTWENPLPEVALASIDFVSTKEVVAPFLVAITAEP